MAAQDRPTVDFVRQVLRYADGELYWLPRSRDLFSSDGQYKTWNKRFAGQKAGCKNLQNKGRHWIWTIRLDGFLYRRSLLTWVVVYGEWPSIDIDHKDRDTLNDRIENLRLATVGQNRANSVIPRTNTTGYKGVTYHKQSKKYMAKIKVNDKNIYIGLFDDPEDAHAAYMAAAREHWGDFACDGVT